MAGRPVIDEIEARRRARMGRDMAVVDALALTGACLWTGFVLAVRGVAAWRGLILIAVLTEAARRTCLHVLYRPFARRVSAITLRSTARRRGN